MWLVFPINRRGISSNPQHFLPCFDSGPTQDAFRTVLSIHPFDFHIFNFWRAGFHDPFRSLGCTLICHGKDVTSTLHLCTTHSSWSRLQKCFPAFVTFTFALYMWYPIGIFNHDVCYDVWCTIPLEECQHLRYFQSILSSLSDFSGQTWICCMDM